MKLMAFAGEHPYSFGSFKIVKRISAKTLQEMHDYNVTSCMLIFQCKNNLYSPKALLAFIDQLERLGLLFVRNMESIC